ncbi:Lymphocyte activation 3 protein [Dissostichus eleginoides]|uniref:Lymphocyte activation 3 protein n=1 Tax=Dissostichus eleginoides TaxID=100907 RepID=A0AAD9C6V3_DISEL|nr:Lymphocyte activation 3 protein [Dissostichus eleginoides]
MPLEYFLFGLITFLLTGVECEETEVFVEAGCQAVLPCNGSPSSSVIPEIIWTKTNKGTVWRKDRSGLQYWGSSWTSKGFRRVQCPHSRFERNDFSLQINNVRGEDGGEYSCRVMHGDLITERLIMLRVIKVSLSSPMPLWGSDASISCDVTPWPQGASLQWTLNDRTFDPQSGSDSDTDQRVVREKATVRLTGIWTCVVGFRGREGESVCSSEYGTKLYAAVGSSVSLPCVFSTGLTPSDPVWEKLKPGFLFKPSPGRLPASFSPSSSSSQPLSDKSASLTEVEVGDKGRYRCSGTLEGQQLNRNMELVVAKIISSPPSKTSVTLTCDLTDSSEVTDYEWVQLISDLNGSQSVQSVQKGISLSINTMSVENQGEWACLFYGKHGILGNVTYHIHTMSGLSGNKSPGSSQNTAAVNHQRRKRILKFPALETIVHINSNEREERERNQEKK